MEKFKEELKKLYKEIFGKRVLSYNFDNPQSTKIDSLIENNPDKEFKFKCNKCKSRENMQDIPFYLNVKKCTWFIIAESPGKSSEYKNKYKLNSVFGWFNTFISNTNNKVVKNYYFDYITNFLKLNLDELYITDAVKCFTNSNNKKRKNEITLDEAFDKCKSYLEKEILLLKPKNIIWLPSSIKILKGLKEKNKRNDFFKKLLRNNNNESWLKDVKHYFHPHFSRQNISKIPVVSRIFETSGNITGNSKLIELSKEINDIYNEICLSGVKS